MPRGLITPTPYTWVNAHDSLFLNAATFSLFRWEINTRELGERRSTRLGGRRVVDRGRTAIRTRAVNKFVNTDLWICAFFASF